MVWQTSTIHGKMEHNKYPALDSKSQIYVTQAQQSKDCTTTTKNIRGAILILQNKHKTQKNISYSPSTLLSNTQTKTSHHHAPFL